jgi:hypothetical protein
MEIDLPGTELLLLAARGSLSQALWALMKSGQDA